MADLIRVPFEAQDSGESELTWGQQHIWDWIQESTKPLSMSATRTLSDGATIEEFVDELRFFMERFQAMRTRLRFDESGRPWQVVARSGEVPLEIVDADDGADPAEVAARVSAVHTGSHFDYVNEWPVRMALVRQGGRLTHLVTTLCHVVVDSSAAMVMFTDLIGRDPQTGAAAGPVTGMPPLELAAWQASPAGRRQSDAALRYWEQHLRTIPARLPVAPVPPGRPATPVAEVDLEASGDERYWRLQYDSPATHMALRRIAARLTSETAPVLLALFAVALARVTGQYLVVFQVIVGNRFRPGFADVVSPVNQPGLCVLDLAGRSLDEAIAHARRRSINAYKYAYYDQFQHTDLVNRVARERGDAIDLGCFVNDRRMQTTVDTTAPLAGEEEVRAALSRSTLRTRKLDPLNKKLMFTISGGEDLMAYTVEADTEYLSYEHLDALVRAVEAAAVEAAFDPAAPVELKPA